MDIDKCLETLRNGNYLEETDVLLLFEKLSEILYQEPTLIPLSLPITICGDIHGQLYDLFELFKVSGGIEKNQYLFLGDYVDRGYFSLETFCYLSCLKLKYPNKIILLRGNHECRAVNKPYGLYDECLGRYGHSGIWKATNEVFDLLPIAAIVSEEIFCIHGGLSPDLNLIEEIPLYKRDQELPSNGVLCDLCWSDPNENNENWQPNPRGSGYLFGQKQTNEFCHINKLSLITRAHEIAMKGYQYFFGEEKIVTVWSAPNYCYRSQNLASVLKIDNNLNRDFIIFDAVPNDQRKIPEEIQSQYFV